MWTSNLESFEFLIFPADFSISVTVTEIGLKVRPLSTVVTCGLTISHKSSILVIFA